MVLPLKRRKSRSPPGPQTPTPPSAKQHDCAQNSEGATGLRLPLLVPAIGKSQPSGRGVTHEDLRDRLAPGSAGSFAAFDAIGRGAGVQHISVGPMLVHATPRIGPVIEQLTADQVTADAPHVLVTLALQMLVADHDVVDIGGLVGQMVKATLVAADAEEGVMVDIVVAAVQAVERADHVGLLAGIEFVRA